MNLVIPEKSTKYKQIEYQRHVLFNINEEKTHQFIDKNVLSQLANVETIMYVDDKVDNYETQVTRRISELMAAQKMEDKGWLDMTG